MFRGFEQNVGFAGVGTLRGSCRDGYGDGYKECSGKNS